MKIAKSIDATTTRMKNAWVGENTCKTILETDGTDPPKSAAQIMSKKPITCGDIE